MLARLRAEPLPWRAGPSKSTRRFLDLLTRTKVKSWRSGRRAWPTLWPFPEQARVIAVPVIGTASWSIPKSAAAAFPDKGSGLQRYASVFTGTEINSTFYRRHKPSTFERWAETTPENFKFAVKLPKEITHRRRMKDIGEPFTTFVQDISGLGHKRGPLLCQLPPSLRFDQEIFSSSFDTVRNLDQGQIVIEARHKSWACEEAIALLQRFSIDRVLADPAMVWEAADFPHPPRYIRLHGKPKIYYSSYTEKEILATLQIGGPSSWCVFDNTASGAAIENALTAIDALKSRNMNSARLPEANQHRIDDCRFK